MNTKNINDFNDFNYSNYSNYNKEDYQNFDLKNQWLKHNYHQSELYGDEALEALLDNYPSKWLQCYTMGKDPESIMTGLQFTLMA